MIMCDFDCDKHMNSKYYKRIPFLLYISIIWIDFVVLSARNECKKSIGSCVWH